MEITKEQLAELDKKEADKLADFHFWIESKIYEAKREMEAQSHKPDQYTQVYTQYDWEVLVQTLKATQEMIDKAIGLEKRLVEYFGLNMPNRID